MLEQLFGSKLRVSVLSWFVLHPDREYYVRQLERILGSDSANLSRELSRLEKAGLLTSSVEGRQKYYRVDAGCPLLPELSGIARKTIDFPPIIREALAPLSGRISVAFIPCHRPGKSNMEGSAPELVVIGSCRPREIDDALADVKEKYGSSFAVTVMSAGDWADRPASGGDCAAGPTAGDRRFVIGDEERLGSLLTRSRLTGAIESWIDRARPKLSGPATCSQDIP